ncbi:putative Ig domain-containing protein [Comamonas sp. JC664]|uniref:putative Ig domain-containing protein n=1 Tax=Comamonas sp. JC664 TaxID=2801917 RepID=UPI001748E62A|nr:putative Ig domain-containing protein [Comamonas sp. JC664]MBL0698648.1 putative Ig domain-containing protein [Comamonas sp. JC664]GHG78334.1 hypothetical protein GCM10012319_28740 [Comamonas sp. KCTC 72670]
MRVHPVLPLVLALLLTACPGATPPGSDGTGPRLAITTTSLPFASVAQAYRSDLEASGGTPAYSWRVTQGALPTGLSLSTLGEITGTPQSEGPASFEAEVRDSRGNTARASFTLEVRNTALRIAASALPDAYLGEAYSAQLEASGGVSPRTWTAVEGALPAGLRLDSQGVVSGVFSNTGTFSITVSVQDATGTTDRRALEVSAFALPDIAGGTLAPAAPSVAYAATLTATGGRPPLSFRVTSGSLPAGLRLEGDTVLGTPGTPSTTSFTVEVQDTNGRAASGTFHITVEGGLGISPQSLPDAYTATTYRQSLTAMNGRAPFAWSLASGTLPAGIRLTAAGTLEGTPSTVGTSTFSLRVTDADARAATRSLSITVYRPPTVTGPAQQLDGYVTRGFSATYSAIDGKPPYTYSLTGELPPGLRLSPSGSMTGTPTSAGSTTGQVVVTDANGRTGSRTVAFTTYELPAITTPSLPEARINVPYSTQLRATGGKAPLTWRNLGAALPPGLALSATGVISGTTTNAQEVTLTVVVTDANGQEAHRALTLTVRETGSTFTVGHWNLEWFGAPNQGPPDSTSPGGPTDDLQIAYARDIIRESGANVWGLVEMVDAADFATLKSQLPGYEGFLANDTSHVPNGPAYYSTGEQKPGILYDSSTLTLQNAQLILTAYDADFGGRPPLRVDFTARTRDMDTQLVVIVLHLKAFADETSYGQRQRSSAALKDYLDQHLPTERVLVIGDWNDDVDQSITRGGNGVYLPTPFAPFVEDTQRYTFITAPLSWAGERTTVGHRDAVDHTLASNEMAEEYLSGSVQILRPDLTIPLPNYGNIVSDHYPVISRYALGGEGGGMDPQTPPRVIINEVLPNEPVPPGQTLPDTHYEFVELYNASNTSVDLSGWSLTDSAAVRHVFASGTSLGPGGVIVVYGGPRGFPPGTPNTVAASSGALGLNNDSDIVSLLTPGGEYADTMLYGETLDNVSYNRSPDLTPDAGFTYHHIVSPGRNASPGRRADGSAF